MQIHVFKLCKKSEDNFIATTKFTDGTDDGKTMLIFI